ncbi:MAG: hypothetical protein ACXVEE_00580 [Polyangiales bacterium]
MASAERDGAEHFVVLEKANVVGVVHVAKVRELLARGASPHDLVSHVMTRERGSVVLDGGRVVGVLEAVVERTA